MLESEDSRLLSVKESAAFMRKHVEHFRELVRKGKLPGPDWHPTPYSRFWRVSTLMKAGKKSTPG